VSTERIRETADQQSTSIYFTNYSGARKSAYWALVNLSRAGFYVDQCRRGLLCTAGAWTERRWS